MLPDRLCQLLTAYVDGELTARQTRAVQRLLGRSAEARTLVRQLQADAAQLRRLPREQLPADFAAQVLLALRERGLEYRSRKASPHRPITVPSWLGLAVAASVLLVISAASYLYFLASAEQPGVATTNQRPSTDERLVGPLLPEGASSLANKSTPSHPQQDRELLPAPQPDTIVHQPVPESEPPTVPQPEREPESILATPTPKMESFPQIADTKLALILSLAELHQPQPHKELTAELYKDSSFRIELACHESGKALDRLRAAFQAQGIRLAVDQVAQDRLKLKLRTSYALYVENVTAEEVAKVLRHLGNEDRKAKPRRQFDKVILQRMTEGDHQEVSKLLGVDPRTLGTTRTKSLRDLDLTQPLAKSTADQVEQALKGQSGRPTPGKPLAKPGERLAVVVPYNPVRPRAASPQVRQFLDSRGPRQPNTLQLVLVLRGNNG